MRVLVTGGAGYIGSHTLVELLEQGHEVTVVDSFVNSSPVPLARVEALSGRTVTWHQADIRDGEALKRILGEFGPEAAIHFAGLKAVGESEEQPLLYYDVNIGGSLRLLEAMEAAGCSRIVFSSSATVYGEPVYLPYDEVHPLAPASTYGRTKRIVEDMLRDWCRARPEASAVILRYFNPVGAHVSGRIGEDPAGIPNNLMPFIAQVATGRRERLRIFGNDYDTPDGTGTRDYIHVTDLARAHVAALTWNHPGAEAFNIGTGQAYSVMEMLDAFSHTVGRALPYEVVERRPGDIASMLADPSRASEMLGWKAELGLDAMCESVWRWQSANPYGFRNG